MRAWRMRRGSQWRPGRASRRAALAGLLGLAAAGALHLLVGPRPPRLAVQTSGDERLGLQVRAALGSDLAGLDRMSVALIEDGQVRFAGFGRTEPTGSLSATAVDADTGFEIGSVTKVLTGMLLAELIASEAVRPDATVAALADTEQSAETGGQASLQRLASHRAGYPSLPLAPRLLLRLAASRLSDGDPYLGDRAWVLRQAGDVTAQPAPFDYSNLGVATLGNVLAVNQRSTYARLVRERILGPLDLDATRFATDRGGLPPLRVQGRSVACFAAEPWLAVGWQPAGVGVWSTSTDLSRLLQAVMAGSAPGSQAARPRWRVDEDTRIGLGWFTSRTREHRVTWHNGGTGGFSSWVGFDRAQRRGAVVLSNTTRSVDGLGERLVLGAAGGPVDDDVGLYGWALVAVMLVLPALWLRLAYRSRQGREVDRTALIRAGGEALVALALARRLVPWDAVPTTLWTAGAALTLGGAVLTAMVWPRLSPGRSRRSVVYTVAHGALVVLLVAASV